ncbi:MBL fold metallo-hydrolase [Liquorilactobacillus vini]|uniref:Exonuclease of the beta-lactamase fold protein n=1 Tax=Liquorilactobacillus vini DSM 20605 TaxID=1133569 RepID=A0A0R2CBH8_9LACO|nr:MBL fold metallo-hydrolase [Liquorilactobacillus vini]KRM88935.1 exonuclease of the beta-lactamase fold protein [Liquorilactobacillus vini DSM 20605]
MTFVKFLGGLNTIGGNIVQISQNDSRIITDFGLTQQSLTSDVKILLHEHVLPPIPDLFLPEFSSSYTHQAIFISHLHLDHTAALAYLKPDVPVYMSRETYELYHHLVEVGLAANLKLDLQVFEPNVPVKIGDLTVTGFASDHDIPGICSLLISDGKHYFAHSGDVRLFGDHYENVKKWAKKFKQLNLDLFMLEGTSFSFPDEDPKEIDQLQPDVNREVECGQRFAQLLKSTRSVPVVNLYPRNIERLLRFQAIAAANHRPIVWEPAFAHLLRHYLPTERILELANESLDQSFQVSWEQINQQPNHYAVQNSFPNLNELGNLDHFSYLHADGGPLGDYDPDYQRLKQFLIDQKASFERIGTSGHASKAEIVKVAKMVNAKETVVWHSFEPQKAESELESRGLATFLPELNCKYLFK